MTREEIAKLIDHTLLKPEATYNDIKKICEEAKKYHFYAVCINPSFVKMAKELLKDTDIKVATVIGFPLGADSINAKVYETKDAILNGADEIDMVINIGVLKSKDYAYIYNEIRSVKSVAKEKVLKVIIEAPVLTYEEKIIACSISKAAGADFVKTSTGFSKQGGATVEDVRLMRSIVGDDVGVKAAGGIRTFEKAVEMINAGANRIGASSSVRIMEG
ncbi:MAG: deoxyribose-phosphate aldolase [Caldisericia bacterium]|nr:deoxyribose-phosphate aldolase [Caldisericia bacterium]